MPNLISDAESQIAEILQRLEEECDALVRGVEVHDIDVTNIDSERHEIGRQVRIELERRPGAEWLQASKRPEMK